VICLHTASLRNRLLILLERRLAPSSHSTTDPPQNTHRLGSIQSSRDAAKHVPFLGLTQRDIIQLSLGLGHVVGLFRWFTDEIFGKERSRGRPIENYGQTCSLRVRTTSKRRKIARSTRCRWLSVQTACQSNFLRMRLSKRPALWRRHLKASVEMGANCRKSNENVWTKEK